VCDKCITSTDSSRNLEIGLLSVSKPFSHHPIDYTRVFSQLLQMLVIIRTLTYSFSTFLSCGATAQIGPRPPRFLEVSTSHSFSTTDCLLLLHYIPVRSKLEHASPVWNNNTTRPTDSNKLERIQLKFAALYFSRVFPYIPYIYPLQLLKLHTVQVRRYHLDALLLIHAFLGSKSRTSFTDNISLIFPFRNIRNFTSFFAARKDCPFTTSATAANSVCNNTDEFSKQIRILKQILC
jgi:hypothetical protein